MFQYEYLIYTPAFYFLVAFTLILTFGYTWGRRWNRRVVTNALDPLLQVFKARDQQFTNIGGQTGFHANIIPGNMRTVRRVDITLTILPRQSLLYLPFSLITRKYDRMQTFFFFNKRGRGINEEAHIIETKFEKRMGNRIEGAESMTREEVTWGERRFHLYFGSDRSRKWLQNCIDRFDSAGPIRHVALIPDEQRAYLFLIPKIGTVAPHMTAIRDWLDTIAESVSSEREADASASS